MQIRIETRRRKSSHIEKRKGGVLVLAAGLLVLIFAFAAFTVDIGFIAITKGQLQNAADSAAHSAVLELHESFGAGAPLTNAVARSNAETIAVSIVSQHRSGDLASTPLDRQTDLKFGHREWNSVEGRWETDWDDLPYNVVEVRVRRARENQTSLPLMFAKVLGTDDAQLSTWATAAVMPGVGFGHPAPNKTVDLLPFTVDLGTWDAFMTEYGGGSTASVPQLMSSHAFCLFSPSNGNNGNNGDSDDGPQFVDNLHFNHQTGTVEQGGDGIPELNIYPDLNSSLPPGNRGTVDLGAPNNSTNDLKRQIVHGLNAYDFSFFPNGIRLDQGPLYLNGDTGISAGINSSLQQIIGDVRAIPIFISVSGPGNNAQYLIVKFVGIRVMAAKLSGGPNKRHLYVEPAPFFSPEVIRGNIEFSADSIMTAPVLVKNSTGESVD